MSEPTRVLQVLGRSAGGIARHVAQLVELLDGRDELASDIAGPPDLPIEMPKPVRPVVIPNGPLLGHRKAIAAIKDLLDEGRYDVVHAHGLRAGIDSALAARGTGLPVVTTVHNLVQPEIAGRVRSRLYGRAEAATVRLSDHVFTVSRQIARHLRGAVRHGAAMSKIEVLHLGIGEAPVIDKSPEQTRAAIEVDVLAPLVVTASRLAPQKALHVLLEAMARLPNDVVLAVLGEGPQKEELVDRALSLGIGHRVRFLGFRHDIADVINAADVFCLSSIWEGVPLAAQEAILLGTTVVATDVGGMSELVTDGVSGRLVPRGDPGALATALKEMLGSPELRRSFTEKARRELETNFSTDAMLDRLTAYYRSAVAPRP